MAWTNAPYASRSRAALASVGAVLMGVPACSAPPACEPPLPITLVGQFEQPLITLDPKALLRARSAQFVCGKPFGPEVHQQNFSARLFDSMPVVSVMDKTGTAISGDKHDYHSIGRYYWPDPTKPDGLPYLRHDGLVNPDVFTEHYDKKASDEMFSAVIALSIGFFFQNNEQFAARAVQHVNAWFIDPATRMNPHLMYAEGVPGRSFGRRQGVIEFSKFVDLFNALALIDSSRAWRAADRALFRQWMTVYFEWLTTHPQPLMEFNARNNHGTYYDAQRVALGLYLGKTDDVRMVIESAKARRVGFQITPDGAQPEETARVYSWFYSTFNLGGLMDLADIGTKVGVDLWNYRTADGRSIRAALDYLLPFVTEGRPWPYQGTTEPGRLYELLLRAAAAYREPSYAALAQQIRIKSPDHDDVKWAPIRLFWEWAER